MERSVRGVALIVKSSVNILLIKVAFALVCTKVTSTSTTSTTPALYDVPVGGDQ